jgi:pimeloyl-ACP methyl ester carboxylesterase
MRNHQALLFIGSILLTGLSTHAQLLERKGALGARLEPVSEGPGVRVVEVLPNGTAVQVGLQAKDVLVQVNEQPVSTLPELVREIGTWLAGQPVRLKIMRNDRPLTLKGRVVGRPMETSEQGIVIYGEVPFDGGALRSILVLPQEVERPPVILWVPGVGCYSQDFATAPRSPYKQWVEGIVAQGIAVFRVEKPGMGDSRNNTPCTEMDLDHEVAAYRAALRHLGQRTDIDTARIFLYGHSMGVLTAPLVAEAAPVAGLIAWGGLATSWFEYELRLIRDQQALEGKDPVAIESDVRRKLPVLTAFYLDQRTPEELGREPDLTAALADYTDGRLWHGLMHYSFFHDLGQLDILANYRKLSCPVLTLAGEFDLHAIDTRWAGTIADAVNATRPEAAESLIVGSTTHHYHTVPSMAAYVAMQADGRMDDAYMAEHFNSEVPKLVADWVRRH